jgi:lipopolysaccharide transport system ATP-binding protein
MSSVITATHVTKEYTIGTQQYTNRLSVQFLENLRFWMRREQVSRHRLPVLRDVSFEIQMGESVGIIGRNGAGKSTLLKIISNITRPTRGRVEVWGQLASLLEVGTGFHPELTGRENVFLSAAIQGMSRADIGRRFDEIVDFSGIEKFIDTPVKHYSSGMYMRLAFAVSAHIDSDILLVDEVLAVGDTEFQKKCIAKMQQSAQLGRTILFVSHNMALLATVCQRCILLVSGEKVADGPAHDVILDYINLTEGNVSDGEMYWGNSPSAPATEQVRLRAVRVLSGGDVTSSVAIDQEAQIEVDYEVLKRGPFFVGLHLFSGDGIGVLASVNLPSANSGSDPWAGQDHPPGVYRTRCTIPANFLNDGRYSLNVVILTSTMPHVEILENHVLSFHVRETGEMRNEYKGEWLGVVRPRLAWMTQSVEDSR